MMRVAWRVVLVSLLLGSTRVHGPRVVPAEVRELVVMSEDRTLTALWDALQEVVARFEATHPLVRVKLVDMSGAAGTTDKVKFLMAGGVPLDVIRIDITELWDFVSEGAIHDLQPWLDADATWNPGDYWPTVLDALRDRAGHLRGLPANFTPFVMYYNRDLLEREGIPVPRAGWTWDDFAEICERVTKDRDGDGRNDQFGISLTQWLQVVAPWIWQAGGRLIDDEGTRCLLDSPEAERAFRFLRKLLHESKVSTFDATFMNQLSVGRFQEGQTAFYGPVGYWETYRFQHLRNFTWDVLPLPRDREAATGIAMQAFVVPRTSRHPELALAFLRELARGKMQDAYAAAGNGVPGYIPAARSPLFLNPDRAPQSEQVYLDVLKDARFLPPITNWSKIYSLCRADLDALIQDPKADVKAACARMVERTNEYLARERQRHGLPSLPAGTLDAVLVLAVLLPLLLLGWIQWRPGLRQDGRTAALMLSPWAFGLLLFTIAPFAVSFLLSLCEWSPLRPASDFRWVGLENYARLGSDPTFATSLTVTLLYALLSVPLQVALALALALLVSGEGRGASALRTFLYIPAIISPVIIGAVWRFLLDGDRGLLNACLARLGLDGPNWLGDGRWVLVSFVLMSSWTVGSQMLVFVAGLKSRDRELLHAARLDGAGPFRRFLHVTLPALGPVLLFNVVVGLVNAFQIFAQSYVMTRGGPGDRSRFLVLYIYETAFRHLDMGYASALAWVLFLLVGFVCLIVMRGTRRWIWYAGGQD